MEKLSASSFNNFPEIYHSAQFAQLVMHFNNAPRVKNINTMLDTYIKQTTVQHNQFEPIDEMMRVLPCPIVLIFLAVNRWKLDEKMRHL